MKNILYLLAGVLVVLAASWTYKVNYQVQEAESRVAHLQRQINRERARIAVLGAEWAYLNRPARLRALAETYYDELRLSPIDAAHFGEISDVPLVPGSAATNGQQVVARAD